MIKRNINVIFFIFTFIFVIVLIYYTKNSDSVEEIVEDIVEEIEIPNIYDIPIDLHQIYYDTVSSGETLGGILQRFGVTALQVDRISKMSCDTFRVTTINIGRPYAVFYDSTFNDKPFAKYFIYENGSVVFTKYDFTNPDSIVINKFRKHVDTVTKTASGLIESSLWNAIIKEGLSWELAIRLSQFYAWTVDFYALQKNDFFKVIYDEYYVEGKSIGIGDIHAGLFNHHNKDLWAIPFYQDGVLGVFDTLGNNTRKTFLKAPLKYTRVSSRYSHARMHPVHKRPRAHLAVDFAAPAGTPVYAASDGVVVTRTYSKGAGYYVKVRHNSVYSTVYMHFSRFGNYNVGDHVSQGDIIGYVGSTGWSTGPHLHYEIHQNGQKIDPMKFEPPPAEPVDSAHIERFHLEKRQWIDKINQIPDVVNIELEK